MSASTWARRKGKAAVASRGEATALLSVSSSLAARCMERERWSTATARWRSRRSRSSARHLRMVAVPMP
ncbi:MAG: hypothetical protein AVDCRST_MAG27-283 [uncultured Craurococcus sp.]|uniref:Uncharacterized protein n=1 Tax=uncultured Craurococcus sp. TaxID=1135998 RepID=A0A6J4HCW6_9PROT|nr:MAG: hypothetical protein AVDCRST_MAG27-283 [uncultured Craurococcus sp.]